MSPSALRLPVRPVDRKSSVNWFGSASGSSVAELQVGEDEDVDGVTSIYFKFSCDMIFTQTFIFSCNYITLHYCDNKQQSNTYKAVFALIDRNLIVALFFTKFVFTEICFHQNLFSSNFAFIKICFHSILLSSKYAFIEITINCRQQNHENDSKASYGLRHGSLCRWMYSSLASYCYVFVVKSLLFYYTYIHTKAMMEANNVYENNVYENNVNNKL